MAQLFWTGDNGFLSKWIWISVHMALLLRVNAEQLKSQTKHKEIWCSSETRNDNIITTTVFVHVRECFCACVQGWMDLISSHFVMCWWLEEVICRGRGGVEGQIEWAVTLIDCSKSCIHTHGFILYICVWRDLLFCLDCPLLSHRVRQRDVEKKPCKIICWIHFNETGVSYCSHVDQNYK